MSKLSRLRAFAQSVEPDFVDRSSRSHWPGLPATPTRLAPERERAERARAGRARTAQASHARASSGSGRAA